MNKEIIVVILLEGNHCSWKILRSMKDKVTELLKNYSTLGNSQIVFLGECFFKADKLIGWYFAEIVENPAAKAVQLLEERMPKADEGDDWKK